MMLKYSQLYDHGKVFFSKYYNTIQFFITFKEY